MIVAHNDHTRNMKWILLLSSLFFCTATLLGQDSLAYAPLQKYHVLDLQWAIYSPTQFAEANFPGTIQLSYLEGKLQFPMRLSDQLTILNHAVSFSAIWPRLSNSIPAYNTDGLFFSISYEFGYVRKLKRHWTFVTTLKPTLASDFQNSLVSEDFLFQGSLLFSKRKNATTKYGVGLSYNTKFGQAYILPIIQLQRNKSHWTTDLLLPVYVTQWYHLKKSKLGTSFRLIGNSYNYDFPSALGYDLDKLSFSKINASINYQRDLANDWAVQIAVGSSIYNTLEFTNSDGESELNLSPGRDFFIQIEILYLK